MNQALIVLIALAAQVALAAPAWAEEAQSHAGEGGSQVLPLTAAELFAFADAARDRGDYELAASAYRALIQEPSLDLRTEARFRLAKMYGDKMGRHRDAATLLRRILDDKPDASGVRLELARMQAEMGNLNEARRELRAVQANGLPPQVEQLVRFYANALSAKKRVGGNIQIAFAPSNNINRATSSDTLGTVIGDFTLDENAQAKSGVGLALKGQAFYRMPLGKNTDLLLRASGGADLYRNSRFDDISFSLQAGPQWNWGRDRLSIDLVTSWRWYALKPYSFAAGISGNWQHPLTGRTQLRMDGSILRENKRGNTLQDITRYTLAAGLDHAFTARFGGGFQVNGAREVAVDAGYSSTSGAANAYIFRELGQTTAVLNLAYRHLEADKRLFLYPRRRVDNYFAASLSGTFRTFSFGNFAPLARIRYERNKSTVGINDFERISGELGIVAAF